MKGLVKNEFHDINKLPSSEGLLVFGISMGRISNSQSAKKCFEYMGNFLKKIIVPKVGLVFLYSDSLYLYSDEKASTLKNKFSTLASSHKNEFMKLLKKNPDRIPTAFSFLTWNQAILESKEFFDYFGRLKKIYQKDKKFQEYIKLDSGKDSITENEINFFLEEILLLYLISKGKIRLRNDYLNEHHKWILNCYPGKPLKSEIYLSQKNFFNLKNHENEYENSFYDLEEKKLYNYDTVDLTIFK